MSLNRLTVHNLRNLVEADMAPALAVNLLYGENGSGKTSVLEAIHLLSVGRSFRSHKIKSLINDATHELTVFGRIATEAEPEMAMGVSRHKDGSAQFRVAGRTVNTAAELVSYLPLQVIDADAFSLLVGSPRVRRQFLDWLVFHVEPGFYQAWRSAQRCLKHRNTLLRRGRIDRFELEPWDQELALASEQIHAGRSRCFSAFTETFDTLVQDFVAVEGLSLKLFRGWDKAQDYSQILKGGLERDIQTGYTHAGVHRADIRIRINNVNAAETLSRGQQKLLVCALKIAQGVVFEKLTQRKCLYLVDDLPAELDSRHRGILVNWLNKLDTQVFITGVEREALLEPWRALPERPTKVFHVEQGRIIQEDKMPA